MAGTVELLKGIVNRLLQYPFFMELADAYVERFPDDASVTAAADQVCRNMGLSKWDIQSRWVEDSFWVWDEMLSAYGVQPVLDAPATEALAEEWVELVKATCDDLNEAERDALDALKEGIVEWTWIDFEENVSDDRFIVLHFHVGGEVCVLWAADTSVGPAGHYVE